MTDWGDVNARVRGLGSRLLPPEEMSRLSEAADLQALARALATLGVLPQEMPGATAPALELALRRAAGAPVRIVRRWLGDREEAMAVALDVEDRRSLRALIRGAAEGVHADARLAGLIPTPTLPERLLQELAGRVRIRDQATLLIAAGHPYGPAILAAAAAAVPDLFAIELAIARTFAERALRGARHAGSFLRAYVGGLIDSDNCRIVLHLAGRELAEPLAPAFLVGGRLSPAELERAARAGNSQTAARMIGAAVGGRLGSLVVRHASNPAALEEALEAHDLEYLRHHARLDPLGPAPALFYLRQLRQQSVALGRLVWGLDFGLPSNPRDLAAGSSAR
jgi:vacuolar-type H+-ATPase subunit C/Vma6